MESVNKKVIAIDTNMLLSIEKLKKNIFEDIRVEYGKNIEIVLAKEVLVELENMEKNQKAVKIAFAVLEQEKPKIILTKAKNADDALLELSTKGIIIKITYK